MNSANFEQHHARISRVPRRLGRAFRIIGNHIAPDDEAAIEAAKPLVDGHDVEVWQRDRKIAVLKHEPE